jgi:hypothetical protein
VLKCAPETPAQPDERPIRGGFRASPSDLLFITAGCHSGKENEDREKRNRNHGVQVLCMLLSCVRKPSLPWPTSFPCGPGYKGRWKRHSREPPSTLTPNWDSSLLRQRIFVTASKWRSGVEKLISDSDGDNFLPLPLFERTPVSRDTDC